MKTSHSIAEARGMICPFMPFYQDAPALCAADGCMAWRWVRTHLPHPTDPKADMVESDDTYGFCGLAGPTP